METITQKINRFYSLISDYKEGAPDTRYKSWEWCHQAFLEHRTDNSEENIEFLSLHLAFYLASWGMYRGSSYLLQRDYKAHKAAVREIIKTDYNELWDYVPSEDNIERINNLLFNTESGIYWKVKNSYKGYDENNANANENNDDESSDTLTTKILMGTFGCIPAFDRFLKTGISCYNLNHDGKKTKIRNYKLTQSIESKKKDGTIVSTDSFKALASLVLENPEIFQITSNFYYPPMKCVDMYLWEVGYEMDIANSLVKPNRTVSEKAKRKLYNKAVELGYCRENQNYEDANNEIRLLNLSNL